MMGASRLICIICIMLASCSQGKFATRSEAASNATNFVKQHPVYSRSEIDFENIVASENTEYFVFKFSPMKGYFGGAPTVYVRKRDGKITRVISPQ